MQLKFSDIDYAIEVINLKNHAIELHDDLIKQQGVHENDNIFYLIHPPIFLKKGEKYFLVARHWTYSFFVSNGIFEFPALIFHDEKLLEQVSRIDESEITAFFSRDSVKSKPIHKYKSRKTITKHKAIEAGRICPFCGGVLRGPRTKEQVKGGGYKITCENKSNKNIGEGKGCDFYAVLTDDEFRLFKKYELPTSKWLKRIDNKKCPKCNSEIFLRVGKDPTTGKLISFERCRNYKNSTSKNCTYNQRYQGDHASAS